MIERLGIALAIAGATYLIWRLARRHLEARRRALLAAEGARPAPSAGTHEGTPTLVYLYTRQCAQCHQQARAVAALEARLGERLAVRKVDALAEPDLATRYEVWTVPATVVLDAGGRSRAINYGLTPADKLEAQVRALIA